MADDEVFEPSAGDMAYRNAKPGLNPFDEAKLLHGISDEYLSVLLHDNKGNERSAGYVAMLEAELALRQAAVAVRANQIATWALIASIVAALAAIISIFA